MNSPLRVLHLEDDAKDTELIQATLEAEAIQSDVTRVETERDFVGALKGGNLDLILADYTLPSFDGLSALKIAQRHSSEVPFIFVSGTLGEDVAIEALKTGATDYVLKTRLNRLGPAVKRALAEAHEKAERKRAEGLLAGEKRILEMVATGIPLKEILNTLCLIIEEQGGGTLASVLLLNSDGVHLNVIAGPNLPNEWTEQMEKMPIGPCAGSCGTAAHRRSPVIVSDIASDPLWDLPEHRASALKHRLRASWSNPVMSSSGKVLGTFCMYNREPRSPSAQDIELIELAAHIAGVAIERDRAEEALRGAEQLARGQIAALMRSLDVLATTSGPAHLITPLLVTVSKQLRARAVLLWLRREADDALELRCAVEGDREIPGDPRHPFLQDPQSWQESRFIEDMLITGAPFVSEDMEHDERIGKQWRAHLTEAGMTRLLAVPVLAGGRVRGFIGVRDSSRGPFRADEIELAQALAHQVMLAVQMAELADQGRHTAILEERTRMARDIHDTLAQGFTGVIMQMEAAEEALVEGEPEETAKHIQRAGQLARESLGEARRSVRALRPQALEKAGFCAALKSTIQNTTIGTSLRTQFNLEGELRELPPAVEENLLQIGREALTNAFKHAHATSFETRLAFEPEMVRLELRDDGDGFVVDGANGGFGLIGMRERAEKIGGTLTVESARGAGTTIVAVAPYQHA